MLPDDRATIAAIATPPGEGAISIVRLSGEKALEIGDRVFRGKSKLAESRGYTLHHGEIVNADGAAVDEVLAAVFRGPHSYTGEDAVEFSCHGGLLVTRSVLEVCLGAGARHAGQGEFSRRSFLNGKMDLSQAEAIADLIAARSERARALSVQQLAGKLGERVRELRGALVDLCALLELDLDFSEEGLDLITRREIRERILGVERSVREMLDRYENGRIVREGATVVITGRPNAGKSSLFNALLKEHRAIVTPHPGTTRDTIEENVLLGGVLFRLVDTAGLRQAIDLAEREGVNRALESVRAADIILLVHDTSIPIKQWEIESILGSLLGNQHLVVAMNKTDLSGIEFDANEREKLLNRGARVVRTSAKSGQGIEELREALAGSVSSGTIEGFQGVEITNDRHRDALQRAHQSLQKSLDTNESGQWKEFIALDVREATSALGEITGEVSSEEILNRIFANFCIGK